ncbi:C-type lectin domain 17 member A [Branchiostoma belcheri]|nr:C-type lectin domain 17 member A [Branchiostoma belcheri]
MPPRGTICCRGSFCRGEKDSPSNKLEREQVGARILLSAAKIPSAANRPSRRHIYWRRSQKKVTPTPNKTANEARLDCSIPGYTDFNGVCYKDFPDRTTYVGALQRCAADGAMLAMPKDSGTNTFISDFITEGDIAGGRWIGVTDAFVEGEWVFQDGRTLASAGYTNWKDGEPNDSSGGEDCVQMLDNSEWNDLGCGDDMRFVCQLDATQQTTEVPTTTTTRYTTDQTTQRTTLPGTTASQNTTNQGAQRSTLPGTTGSQNTTNQGTQWSTLPRTTVFRYTTDQTTQRPTLPGTSIVSQQATNQTTTPAGGEASKATGSVYNTTWPLHLALFFVGCAVGVGSVLLYIYGKRRQRSRQVTQDLQD